MFDCRQGDRTGSKSVGGLGYRGGMEVRVAMRQAPDGSWSARMEGPVEARATGPDAEGCLAALRAALADGLDADGEAVTLVVETVPQLAGVAEAAAVLGWDKRRVITYINRGSFPPPVQALASGRVWLRRDVEAFAEEWQARYQARQRARRRAAPKDP